jgi:plasmid stabilization system protein ParE
MYTLIYSSKAEKEFLEAYDYYEERLLGLGDRFVNCIESKVESIVKNPYAYSIRRKNLHEYWVKEFPFLIVYQILEKENLIVIASVFHTSRNPKKKYRK